MGLIITGGEFRGRRLATDSGSGLIRPTSGKVREAIFSSLAEEVPGARFLDLFAGSGAVGLEAFSRGAVEVQLVENHPKSYALLKANCASLGEAAGLRPIRAAAAAFCRARAEAGESFDLVFADPPFADDFSELPAMLASVLAPRGTAIVQYPARQRPSWADAAYRDRAYGESGLAFFHATGSGGARSIF